MYYQNDETSKSLVFVGDDDDIIDQKKKKKLEVMWGFQGCHHGEKVL
jgi:hypothetical protein